MPGVEVAAGAVVQRALVADNVKIGQDAVEAVQTVKISNSCPNV